MNSRTILFLASVLIAAGGASARGQNTQQNLDPPEIVVTATRLPTPTEQVASSLTVITGAELARKQQRTLDDALTDVPGLYIARSGAFGKSSRIFMRGAESRHVLVLIDGAEIGDPASPDGAFEFQHLLTDDIERIEILRGPNAALYGSDAIGGVINIITKRGRGPLALHGRVEGGSFSTFNQAAGLSGSTNGFDYAFDVGHFRSEGISITPARLRGGGSAEEDGYDNLTLSTRLGAKPAENLEFRLNARYGRSASKLDTEPEDPNSEEHTRQLFARGEAKLSLFDGRLTQTLGAALTDYRRRDEDLPDAADLANVNFGHSISAARFDSQKQKLDWQGTLHLSEEHALTLGAETENESADTASVFTSFFGGFPSVFSSATVAEARTNAAFAQVSSAFADRLFATLSLRRDEHENFPGETTWRVAPAYLLRETDTKFKGAYGTGFRAPTLFQLFGRSYLGTFGIFSGNPNLKPETSTGWEAGFEQGLFDDRIRFGGVYFANDIEDLIVFTGDFSTLENRARAKIQGVESFAEVRLLENLNVRADHTWLEAVDATTQRDLLRRPQHKASVALEWQATGDLSFDLGALYIGHRADVDAVTFATKRLGGHTVVNFAVNYQINPSLGVFGRVDNVLDRKFEDPDGFAQPGIAGFAGIKGRL